MAGVSDYERGYTQHYAQCKRNQKRNFCLAQLFEKPGVRRDKVHVRFLVLHSSGEGEVPETDWQLLAGADL